MTDLRLTRTESLQAAGLSPIGDKKGASGSLSPNSFHRSPSSGAELLDVPLLDVVPFRFNPRTHIDDQALGELAAHIRENGLLTPLIVRLGPLRGTQKYDLVAGERRRRACLLAGLETAPCIVWEGVGHADAVCAALVENIMREDLSPMEVANGLRAMLDLDIKKGEVARRVGRSPGYVSNHLKLLGLPHEIQRMLSGGGLTESLARTALVVISRLPEREKIDPVEFMRAISRQPGASVHALERGDFPEETVKAFPALQLLAADRPTAADRPMGAERVLPIGDQPPPPPTNFHTCESPGKVSSSGMSAIADKTSADKMSADTPASRQAVQSCAHAGRVGDASGPVRLPEGHVRLSDLRPPDKARLTRQQRLVLWLTAEGLSAQETADALFIAPRTVASHKEGILDAIAAPSMTQACVWGALHGLYDEDGICE